MVEVEPVVHPLAEVHEDEDEHAQDRHDHGELDDGLADSDPGLERRADGVPEDRRMAKRISMSSGTLVSSTSACRNKGVDLPGNLAEKVWMLVPSKPSVTVRPTMTKATTMAYSVAP